MKMEPSVRVELNQVAPHLWLVSLHGDYDLSNSREVDAAITAAFGAGSRVVVDMTEASFIDSSVLGCLLIAKQRAGTQHDLAVVAAPDSLPRRVLEVTNLAAHIPVYDTCAQALETLEPAEPAVPATHGRAGPH
jgi:anti-anti-sigma factor